MKIVIDGMDGVGKSTVANILADKYGYEYIDRPIQRMFGFEDFNDEESKKFEERLNRIFNNENPIIKAWLTGLGNIYSLANSETKDIIIDRNILSNYFWNGNDENEEIYESIMQASGMPDITIVLYASVKTRIERIRLRDKIDADLEDPDVYKEGYEKMAAFLKKHKIPYIAINTENKNIDEVVREIESKVKFINNKENEKDGIVESSR